MAQGTVVDARAQDPVPEPEGILAIRGGIPGTVGIPITGKAVSSSRDPLACGNVGTAPGSRVSSPTLTGLRLALAIGLQSPARDDVEALRTSARDFDVLLEPQFPGFGHGLQQAGFRACPGNLLGPVALAGVPPTLGMEKVVQPVVPIPAAKAGAIGNPFALVVPVGEAGGTVAFNEPENGRQAAARDINPSSGCTRPKARPPSLKSCGGWGRQPPCFGHLVDTPLNPLPDKGTGHPKVPCFLAFLVGASGIEPPTPTVSR